MCKYNVHESDTCQLYRICKKNRLSYKHTYVVAVGQREERSIMIQVKITGHQKMSLSRENIFVI